MPQRNEMSFGLTVIPYKMAAPGKQSIQTRRYCQSYGFFE